VAATADAWSVSIPVRIILGRQRRFEIKHDFVNGISHRQTARSWRFAALEVNRTPPSIVPDSARAARCQR